MKYLSEREQNVVQLRASGLKHREIAEILGIKEGTSRDHMVNSNHKFRAEIRAEQKRVVERASLQFIARMVMATVLAVIIVYCIILKQ